MKKLKYKCKAFGDEVWVFTDKEWRAMFWGKGAMKHARAYARHLNA